MNPKFSKDYQGFLNIQNAQQACEITQHLNNAGSGSKKQQRKQRHRLITEILENKTLLQLAYPVLSEERIKELSDQIHATTLKVLDLHFNSFPELRELFNAIPWNMPHTDHWILHEIMLRLNTRENRTFHQHTAWKLLQKSSREFPLHFALNFWDIST